MACAFALKHSYEAFLEKNGEKKNISITKFVDDIHVFSILIWLVFSILNYCNNQPHSLADLSTNPTHWPIYQIMNCILKRTTYLFIFVYIYLLSKLKHYSVRWRMILLVKIGEMDKQVLISYSKVTGYFITIISINS